MMQNSERYRHVLRADLLIRPLVIDDLPQVLTIERQGYSHPWSESVFADCFRSNYRLSGVVRGGALVGYAVVAYLADEAHLLNLCVQPGYRGKGAGRQLLRFLLAEAVREGMARVILEVRESNDVAYGLYLAEGFEEIGRRPEYYPAVSGREDARVMALAFQR